MLVGSPRLLQHTLPLDATGYEMLEHATGWGAPFDRVGVGSFEVDLLACRTTRRAVGLGVLFGEGDGFFVDERSQGYREITACIDDLDGHARGVGLAIVRATRAHEIRQEIPVVLLDVAARTRWLGARR